MKTEIPPPITPEPDKPKCDCEIFYIGDGKYVCWKCGKEEVRE
jgi:hypothetical protein